MAYYCAYGDTSDEDSSESDVGTMYNVYHRSFPGVLGGLERSVFEEIYYQCVMTRELERQEGAKKTDEAGAKMAEERKLREEAAKKAARKIAGGFERSVFEEIFNQCVMTQEVEHQEGAKKTDEAGAKMAEEKKLHAQAAKETADKKAAEFIETEEMQRRKREKNIKKHLKKKARKQAKKLADSPSPGVAQMTQKQDEANETVETNTLEASTEDLDPCSAFALKSIQKWNLKVNNISSLEQKDQPMEKTEDLRKLAATLMQQDFLAEACSVLSRAISIAPEETETYLERAKCFYKLERFDKAVQDAMVNIEGNPRSIQAHVLVSKAYASRKLFDKAEEALMTAKNVVGYTQEIQTELKQIGILKLIELGFEEAMAVGAMGRKLNFEDALDELTWDVEKLTVSAKDNEEGEHEYSISEDGDNAVGYTPSDDGAVNKSNGSVSSGEQGLSAPEPSRSLWVGSVSYTATREDLHTLFRPYGKISIFIPPMATFAFVNFTTIAEASNALNALNNYNLHGVTLVIRYAKPNAKFAKEFATWKKVDPRNPHGIRSIYVANVVSRATEKELTSVFSTCGHVTSCQILRDKKCAFVNYATSAEATKALEKLQNFRLKNISLVLKFANNTQNIVIGNKQDVQSSPVPAAQASAARNECVFWRKGECVFEDKCWQLHIPEHKGIDA